MCEKYQSFLEMIMAGEYDRVTCGTHPWCAGCEHEDAMLELTDGREDDRYDYRREFFAYEDYWSNPRHEYRLGELRNEDYWRNMRNEDRLGELWSELVVE